jgi:hypothetical protein
MVWNATFKVGWWLHKVLNAKKHTTCTGHRTRARPGRVRAATLSPRNARGNVARRALMVVGASSSDDEHCVMQDFFDEIARTDPRAVCGVWGGAYQLFYLASRLPTLMVWSFAVRSLRLLVRRITVLLVAPPLLCANLTFVFLLRWAS